MRYSSISWEFWKKNPAFLMGIHLPLGSALALQYSPCFFFSLSVIWIPLLLQKENRTHTVVKFFCSLLTLLFAFLYTQFLYPRIAPIEKTQGTAYFSISSLKSHHSPFAHSFLYKGTLDHFQSYEGKTYSNLPCTLYFPMKKDRPLAHCDYILEGTLQEKKPYNFVLKLEKQNPWTPVPKTFSLAEWRYQAKQKIAKHLKKTISDEKSAQFLSALVTGEIEERSLSFDFAKLGLQHILAISGFHFALLAAFCGFLFRLFLPRKLAAYLLFAVLTAYFFFLGNAPSILRAWTAISLFLIAQIWNLRTSALNALGVGLILEILINPLVVQHLGFQLSFLCTLAILFFYRPVENALRILFPKRKLEDVIIFSKRDQAGYILSSFFRKTLALNLSVHAATILPLLYLFQKFPLLSLAYNLFFPLAVSLSLFLLLIGELFTHLLPLLGNGIHHCNSAFTSFLLEMTSRPPAFLDYYIRTPNIPFEAVILFLSALLLLGVRWMKTKELNVEQLG